MEVVRKARPPLCNLKELCKSKKYLVSRSSGFIRTSTIQFNVVGKGTFQKQDL